MKPCWCLVSQTELYWRATRAKRRKKRYFQSMQRFVRIVPWVVMQWTDSEILNRSGHLFTNNKVLIIHYRYAKHFSGMASKYVNKFTTLNIYRHDSSPCPQLREWFIRQANSAFYSTENKTIYAHNGLQKSTDTHKLHVW